MSPRYSKLSPEQAADAMVRAAMAEVATKADIIRAHPDLHPREIRKRYGISVNHVRVQRAQDKAKNSGKLK